MTLMKRLKKALGSVLPGKPSIQLQRYLQSRGGRGVYFGEHTTTHTYDFKWFHGEDRIGVEGHPSTEAESFINGFLVRDDKLIITPDRIQRASDNFGIMAGVDSGVEQVKSLIELLNSQETTHAFTTSAHEHGSYGSILTFSTVAPPDQLYKPGKVMPIEFYEG